MNRLDINEAFSRNLEIERMRLGLTQQRMANELGISLSGYKRIINLSTEKIDLFMTYKLHALTGKMVCEFMGIQDEYMETFRLIKSLSKEQLLFVKSVIDFESELRISGGDGNNYLTVFVPTGNMEDGMIYDSSNIEKIVIPANLKSFGKRIDCGIKVTSNHLHPTYNLGDVLLVSFMPIRDGDTGIFVNRENHCAYIRKFHQTSPCSLEPVNGLGEIFYVDSNDIKSMDKWIKFGIIVSKIR